MFVSEECVRGKMFLSVKLSAKDLREDVSAGGVSVRVRDMFLSVKLSIRDIRDVSIRGKMFLL